MALEHLHYIGDGVQLTVGDAQNHGGKGSFGGMKLYKKRDGGEKFQIYGGAMWCRSSMLVVQEKKFGEKFRYSGAQAIWCKSWWCWEKYQHSGAGIWCKNCLVQVSAIWWKREVRSSISLLFRPI